MSETFLKIGPFNICLWNLVFLVVIFVSAVIIRKLLSRFLKQTLKNNNIQIEGRKETYLKLFTQSVYLIALYVAVLSFRFNNANVTFEEFIKYNLISFGNVHISLYNLILVIAIFIVARMVINLFKLYLGKRNAHKANYDPGVEFVYVQLAKYVVNLLAIVLALNILNINVTLILTGSVGLLVGLGLGLQDVFKDMIAGVVLLVEGNLKVGDIVEINGGNLVKDASTTVAKILKISFRTTQIETREGNVLIIPNSRLTQQQVENWSHSSPLSMFTIPVVVDFGFDTEIVSNLLILAAKQHPKVKKNEPVFVRLSKFADHGIELELVFWAEHSWDIGNYKSDIRFEIDKLFREHGIIIPYPTRTIINKG